jgi:DNA-binding response OmpR family regulator
MKNPVGKTILVIEDNEVIIELMERNLGRAGYRVVGCSNSRDYRDYCLRDKPDLIILDILMPVKSGWEILEELKRDEETKSIPVIISSVKSRQEDVNLGLQMGAVDFISKPYVFVDLLEKIAKHIGKS